MTNYVLCQDCLRVLPYTDERHNGLELCKCGGDLCGCPSCSNIVDQLIKGELTAKQLDIIGDDLLAWSPDDGVIEPKGDNDD